MSTAAPGPKKCGHTELSSHFLVSLHWPCFFTRVDTCICAVVFAHIQCPEAGAEKRKAESQDPTSLRKREHCDLKHAWLGPRTLLLLLLMLMSYIPAASLLQGLHLTDALQNTLHHREGPRYSPQPQGQINRSNWGCSWDWCLKHRAAPTNNTKDSSKFCVTDRAPTSPWSAARTGILLF